jgi:hypothetical protein
MDQPAFQVGPLVSCWHDPLIGHCKSIQVTMPDT